MVNHSLNSNARIKYKSFGQSDPPPPQIASNFGHLLSCGTIYLVEHHVQDPVFWTIPWPFSYLKWNSEFAIFTVTESRSANSFALSRKKLAEYSKNRI